MKKNSLFLLCLMLIILTACSKESVEKEEEKKVEKEVEPVVVEPVETPSYPLTGLPSQEESTDRAVSVMINNHSAARPQTGLTDADLVYEVLAEGEVTRFLAVYQSTKPESVGPVRSARDYFLELAKGYNSFYVAHGYSEKAKELLDSGYIDHINGMQYDGTLFQRSTDRVAPHNSYISFANIEKGAKQNNYSLETAPEKLPFLSMDEVESLEGTDSNMVSISYGSISTYNSQFIYEEDIQKYIRTSDGEQTVDLETKEPVAVDNVFIIEAEHQLVGDSGRRSIDLTSGGKAYLIQRGKWQEVDWQDVNGRPLPFNNGKPVGLVPGKTWINIIPSKPGLDKAISFE